MTGKQKRVLGLTSLASLMVALDALVVSTVLSTIRLHDLSETRAVNLSETRAVNLGPDR